MNIIQAEKQVLLNTLAGNFTMLSSPSGYGKSTMLLQAFKRFQQKVAPKTVGLGIIFLATQSPADLVGIYFKGERTFTLPDGTSRTVTVTDPTIPLWAIDIFTGKPYYLFDTFCVIIEEADKGDLDTKKAAAEIMLNGGIAPHYLPPGSMRVGCKNSGARYGANKDFLFCLSRRTDIEITPDANIVVDYWDKPYNYQGRTWQVQGVIKHWAKTNPQVLFEKEPEKDAQWANPRTVCSFARYLQVYEDSEGGVDLDDPALMEVGEGTLGMPATQSILTSLKFSLSLPTEEQIISDPIGTPMPVKADLLMLLAYQMASWANQDNIASLLTFMDRNGGKDFPKDMGITFATSLLRRDYNLVNVPAMAAWLSKRSAMIAMLDGISRNQR